MLVAPTDSDGVYQAIQPAVANFSILGVEKYSSIYRGMGVKNSTNAVSPLTNIITDSLTEADVRRLFGMGSGGPYAVPSDVSLVQYSSAVFPGGDARLPGAIYAANLRVEALRWATWLFRQQASLSRDSVYRQIEVTFFQMQPSLSAYVARKPAASLVTVGELTDYLGGLRPTTRPVRDDVIQAAALLLSRYFDAAKQIDTNAAITPRYSLLQYSYVHDVLVELYLKNSAAAAADVSSITTAQLVTLADSYTDPQPLPTGTFLPATDVLHLAPSGSATVYRYYPMLDPLLSWQPNMLGNDVDYGAGTYTITNGTTPSFGDQADGTVTAVRVPAKFAGAITATLQANQSAIVQAKPGFTGVAWFEYDATSTRGNNTTGRVYVTVF